MNDANKDAVDVERFTEDIEQVAAKLSSNEEQIVMRRINYVKQRLVELYKRNLVKINHSVLELICAKHFIKYGYDVDVERQLNDVLICDVYASKGDNVFIVEIETGFVPPEHALDPVTYTAARVASKIARYSAFAGKFALATPVLSLLPVQELFLKPPRYRNKEEVARVKALCDRYYSNPPISMEEIKNSRLHSIMIINADDARVIEIEPETYVESIKASIDRVGIKFY
ncbi:MAG: hypothetical protein ABI341_00135 [Nitrososphaera sp.]|uniref:Uncharacterized protein n=1 Tax=Candidatus Nitrosocaldus cavascurensis TaxID=2058097 RepID=A0A2K5AS81_9ARCH|nr:hypothetical protein [Candidatus Nitrosocaldus islandicus]SPC34464.1 conserved protein of unknown function [Candidatus Nitrosocaldus cavascurensis]